MPFVPDPILLPSKCDPHLRAFTKSGPATVTGRQQRVFSDAGFWEVDYEIRINTPAKIRAYRAMMGRLRTGETAYFPIFERAQAVGALSVEAVAALQGSVSLRDTEITIRATGVRIEAGIFFGIGDRLYQVNSVVSGSNGAYHNPVSDGGPWSDRTVWSDTPPAPVDFTVKIVPPMRSGFASGVPVKLTGISLLGTLADMGQGDLTLEQIARGTASFRAREST